MTLRALTVQTLSTNRFNVKRTNNPKLSFPVSARLLLVAGGGGGGVTNSGWDLQGFTK